MIKEYRREYMRCWKCGCDVTWDSRIDEDKANFRGVADKTHHHIENDPMCKREVFLSEILGEKIEKGIKGLAGVDQSPQFMVREITIDNNKESK